MNKNFNDIGYLYCIEVEKELEDKMIYHERFTGGHSNIENEVKAFLEHEGYNIDDLNNYGRWKYYRITK